MFIDQIKALGFVVPNCTQSNYGDTMLSMAATLNMNYIDEFGIPLSNNSTDDDLLALTPLISNNLVRNELSKFGYTFISFASDYPFIDIKNSDIYYDYQANLPFYKKSESANFHYMFLRTTAWRLLIEAEENHPVLFNSLPDWLIRIINPESSYFTSDVYIKYEENLYNIETIQEIPRLSGKKFDYIHLLVTHSPYVFNPDGSMRDTRGEGSTIYIDQISFINPQLIEIINTIINESETPPIIIIQGDHSEMYGDSRDLILNAYYLPYGGDGEIYPTITPVNTFRVILSYYFNLPYSMLPDYSYYSEDNKNRPYDLLEVPATCVNNP